MSRIIKAAELKVLVPNESQTVIPAPRYVKDGSGPQKGTILQAADLIANAQEEAARIVEQARQEADRLVKEAQSKVEVLQQEASEKGFKTGRESGFQQGRQEASKEAESLLELLKNTVQSAAKERAKALGALEEDFLKFSLILADKIVKKAVGEDISWLKPLVEEGLSRLGTVRQVEVRLHPEDYALMQEQQHQLQLEPREGLRFRIDPDLTRGGCVLESENGAIDARLEKRLGKLSGHLLEVLYNGES
ncbi:MAG: hypothetical protein GX335_03220 [Firmicutes bacterium]|nr:hypothetical protein [Bacillota bacterium]